MNYSCSAYELACNECGKRYGNQPLSACPDCVAPLELVYDLDSARGVFTRESKSNDTREMLNSWRKVGKPSFAFGLKKTAIDPRTGARPTEATNRQS